MPPAGAGLDILLLAILAQKTYMGEWPACSTKLQGLTQHLHYLGARCKGLPEHSAGTSPSQLPHEVLHSPEAFLWRWTQNLIALQICLHNQKGRTLHNRQTSWYSLNRVHKNLTDARIENSVFDCRLSKQSLRNLALNSGFAWRGCD